LEDDLMRIFGTERLDSWLQKLGLEKGEAIVHPWINRALEKAQGKVEARNFDIRKQLLKYDDVMNDQRKVIYEQRREIMEVADVQEFITGMREELVDELVARFIPENAYADQWETSALHEETLRIFNLNLPVKDWAEEEGIADAEIKARLQKSVDELMESKEQAYGVEMMRMAEKSFLLRILDQQWKDHLLSLDHLRQGINLRAYGQRDPLNEYKNEAFEMFQGMLARLRENVTGVLCHLQLGEASPDQLVSNIFEPESDQEMTLNFHEDPLDPGEVVEQKLVGAENWDKTPRNAPCPCGSGKRYKQCHGRFDKA
jgi:preprotein translocase subunit SecA